MIRGAETRCAPVFLVTSPRRGRPSVRAGGRRGSAQKKIDDMKSSSYYAPKQLFSPSLFLPSLARSAVPRQAARQPASQPLSPSSFACHSTPSIVLRDTAEERGRRGRRGSTVSAAECAPSDDDGRRERRNENEMIAAAAPPSPSSSAHHPQLRQYRTLFRRSNQPISFLLSLAHFIHPRAQG